MLKLECPIGVKLVQASEIIGVYTDIEIKDAEITQLKEENKELKETMDKQKEIMDKLNQKIRQLEDYFSQKSYVNIFKSS